MGTGRALKIEAGLTSYSGRLVVSNADVVAGDSIYVTFYNSVTNEAWDENDTGGMVSNATLTHANAALACTDERDLVSDGWYVPIPATLPDGVYIVKFYNNATPADTDAIVLAKAMNIYGGFAQSINDN